MGDLGLFGLVFPERWGGSEGDFASLCVAIEELGRVDQSMGITLSAGVGLGANPIHQFGDEQQQDRWLPDLVAGRRARRIRADRAGRRQRRRRHPHPGPPRRRRMGDRREQGVHHQLRHVDHLDRHRHRPHRRRHLRVRHPCRHAGDDHRARVRQAGLARQRHPRHHARQLPGPGREPARQARAGLPQLPRHPRRRAHRHLGAGARMRTGVPRARGRVRQAAQRVRRADRPVPRSRLPALRPRRGRRERAQPDLQGGVAEGPGPPDRPSGGDGQAVLDRDRGARDA